MKQAINAWFLATCALMVGFLSGVAVDFLVYNYKPAPKTAHYTILGRSCECEVSP